MADNHQRPQRARDRLSLPSALQLFFRKENGMSALTTPEQLRTDSTWRVDPEYSVVERAA
jgi:hypothetical protein